MAAFLAKNPADSVREAEENGQARDEVFSTLPELSMPASDHALENFAPGPTANEIMPKEDMNVQTSAGSSPRLDQETQVLSDQLVNPNGRAPTELEKNFGLSATDITLPPLVKSVTDNMLKVSITQALSNSREHPQQHFLENDESSHTKHHELDMVILAAEVGDVPWPLSSNGHADTVEFDVPSLQVNDCKMVVDSSKDCKPWSLTKDGNEPVNVKDDGKGDQIYGNADADDDGDNDNQDAEDDDEKVDESSSEVEEDSDSSSSTSSSSFTSSSDDDDEVRKLHLLLNGANNKKDVVMEVESECEEGELKESPSRKKKGGVEKKMMNASSEDEEDFKEPVKSKNKTKDLPCVPKVSVKLEPHHTTVPVGFVSSVVGVRLIVEGFEGLQALNEGSILWLTDHRQPLGIVDELFGPVKKPFYVVRYNEAMEMPEGGKEGAQVSYVRDFADFVLKNDPGLYAKGYDEAGDDDLSDSEVYFSDDEKEAEYRCAKSTMKRGNPETSTFEFDNGWHQEKRAEGGKRVNKDNKNRSGRGRGRGEGARSFQSNNDAFGRPPRHRNGRCEQGEPSFGNYVEPMQTSDQGHKHWRRGESPVHRRQLPQQTLGVSQSKSSTPESSTSDSTHPRLPPRRVNQQPNIASPSPMSQDNMFMNQLCNSLQPNRTDQIHASEHALAHTYDVNQSQNITHLTSQQVQPLVMNQPQQFLQSSTQKVPMNQPLGSMQAWQSNEKQMTPQPLGFQHAQMPAYNNSVMTGRPPQASTAGYGIPLGNKPPLQQSGVETVQGLPPTYQSPMYQQQVPPLNQFSSSPMLQHLPGQGSQVAPNMGIPIGNLMMQGVHANGYAVGIQPPAVGTPVLGIPAVPTASTPFSYSPQMVSNQNFSGVTPGGTLTFAAQSQPSTYGTPEIARTLPPMAGSLAPSWQQQQQHLPHNSSDPMPHQSYHGPRPQHRRPHISDQRRGSYQGRRF